MSLLLIDKSRYVLRSAKRCEVTRCPLYGRFEIRLPPKKQNDHVTNEAYVQNVTFSFSGELCCAPLNFVPLFNFLLPSPTGHSDHLRARPKKEKQKLSLRRRDTNGHTTRNPFIFRFYCIRLLNFKALMS